MTPSTGVKNFVLEGLPRVGGQVPTAVMRPVFCTQSRYGVGLAPDRDRRVEPDKQNGGSSSSGRAGRRRKASEVDMFPSLGRAPSAQPETHTRVSLCAQGRVPVGCTRLTVARYEGCPSGHEGVCAHFVHSWRASVRGEREAPYTAGRT